MVLLEIDPTRHDMLPRLPLLRRLLLLLNQLMLVGQQGFSGDLDGSRQSALASTESHGFFDVRLSTLLFPIVSLRVAHRGLRRWVSDELSKDRTCLELSAFRPITRWLVPRFGYLISWLVGVTDDHDLLELIQVVVARLRLEASLLLAES